MLFQNLVSINNQFFAIYQNTIFKSTDGENWSKRLHLSDGILEGIESNGKTIIAKTNNNKIYISGPDGQNWELAATMDQISERSTLYFYRNKFYVVDLEGNRVESIDGRNWNKIQSSKSLAITHAVSGDERLMAISENGKVYLSGDSLNWSLIESHPIAEEGSFRIDWIDGKFFIFYDGGYLMGDGNDWERSITENSMNEGRMIQGESDMLFVGDECNVSYGPNIDEMKNANIDCQFKNIPPYGSKNLSAAYGNGKYIAIEPDGLIHISEDGNEWQEYQLDNESNSWFYWLSYGNGKFLASVLSHESQLFSSEDGLNWDLIYSDDQFNWVYPKLLRFSFGAGTFFYAYREYLNTLLSKINKKPILNL